MFRSTLVFIRRSPCPTNRLVHATCQRWAAAVSASSSSKGENKKQAMKRQLQQTRSENEEQQKTAASSATSLPPPSLSFQQKISPEDSPLSTFSSGQPTQIQLNQDLSEYTTKTTWESDKRGLLSPSTEITFEKEAMFDPAIHLPYVPQDWKGYEPVTPLSEFLMQRIGVSGQPITTAEFMRHALTHPLHGYYTNPPKSALEKSLNEEVNWDDTGDDDAAIVSDNNSTLIGPGGDFVTAPEVSHVFGHCICVWLVTQWQALDKPSEIQLVELGPGRGTLMVDILQLATSSKLIDFGRSIHTVNFIEASKDLRMQQQEALVKALGDKIDFDFVDPSSSEEGDDGVISDKQKSDGKMSMRVEWHEHFTAFNLNRQMEMPVMMVAQEFFDALPVHAFQYTEEGWRERLIDMASTDDKQPEKGGDLVPRLRQVLAPDMTPAAEMLLSSSQYGDVPVGTVVEVCPEGMFLVQDMAKVVDESQGCAIIFDYGQNGTSDSLRAFSNHRQVPLTSNPGQVDITADVDFYALTKCIEGKGDTHAFGPVTQGAFLMRMGAGDMVIKSIESPETSAEHAQRLSDALKYLVMPENMGERFKVLALARKRDGIFAPPGMEQ